MEERRFCEISEFDLGLVQRVMCMLFRHGSFSLLYEYSLPLPDIQTSSRQVLLPRQTVIMLTEDLCFDSDHRDNSCDNPCDTSSRWRLVSYDGTCTRTRPYQPVLLGFRHSHPTQSNNGWGRGKIMEPHHMSFSPFPPF